MNKYLVSLQRLLDINRPERRRSMRYPTVTNRASLAWWDGTSSRQSASQLVNISQGGTLVAVDRPVAEDQDVWVRLEEPTQTDWVPARVVRGSRSHKAALAFPDGCPYDFFKAATHGDRLDTSRAQAAALEFDRLGWR